MCKVNGLRYTIYKDRLRASALAALSLPLSLYDSISIFTHKYIPSALTAVAPASPGLVLVPV